MERRDAGVPASKLRCDEGLGGKAQQGICYFGVYLQWKSVHRGEGGQRAGVRLGGVQGRRGDCAGRRDLRVHLRGTVRVPDAEGDLDGLGVDEERVSGCGRP